MKKYEEGKMEDPSKNYAKKMMKHSKEDYTVDKERRREKRIKKR